jgi:hypothetical protein
MMILSKQRFLTPFLPDRTQCRKLNSVSKREMDQPAVCMVTCSRMQPLGKGRLDVEIITAAEERPIIRNRKAATDRRRFPQASLLKAVAEHNGV